MIIKKEKQRYGGNLAETAKYFKDKKNAAPGEDCGPKVAFYGTVNGLKDDWDLVVGGMWALEKEWRAMRQGTGKPFLHTSINLKPGEGPWTPETAQEAVKIQLKHLGMEGHLAIWSVHKDRPHSHIHLYICQVKPEPDAQGIYRLAWNGASCENAKGSNKIESLHKAEAEIRAKQGWQRIKGVKYDYVDGEFIQTKRAPDPEKENQVDMGVKIRGYEIRNGQKHPKTILAELSRDVIQAFGKDKDKEKAIAALAAKGITYKDTDYVDAKGRRHTGGLLTSPEVPKGVKVSSLPKDCRWIVAGSNARGENTKIPNPPSMPVKISGFGDAQKHMKKLWRLSTAWPEFFQKIEAAGMTYEQTGKSGGRIRFAPGDTGTIKLSECGTSFSKLEKLYGKYPAIAQHINKSKEKVNPTINKNASKPNTSGAASWADKLADSAEAAQDRATAASAHAAQTLTGNENFYQMDFFEQAAAMMRTINATDAAFKSAQAAWEAEKRAREAEAKAKKIDFAAIFDAKLRAMADKTAEPQKQPSHIAPGSVEIKNVKSDPARKETKSRKANPKKPLIDAKKSKPRLPGVPFLTEIQNQVTGGYHHVSRIVEAESHVLGDHCSEDRMAD